METSPHMEPHLRAWIAACATIPGGAERGHGGAIWSESDVPWPMFSGGTGGSADDVRAGLSALRGNGSPFFWWTTSDTPDDVRAVLAEQQDLIAFDVDAPWEEARIADLPAAVLPDGVRLEEVRGEAAHRTWATTLREAYDFPDAGERSWLETGRRCGWQDLPWRQWIAFDDAAGGVPLGVALLFRGGGIAGLFGVGTLERARRRGIGRALTLVPLHASGDDVAGFFSTEDGGLLYRTLGFAPRGSLTRWLWLPGSSR